MSFINNFLQKNKIFFLNRTYSFKTFFLIFFLFITSTQLYRSINANISQGYVGLTAIEYSVIHFFFMLSIGLLMSIERFNEHFSH